MNDAERWSVVLERRSNASFFYAVRSTGIYCRPSCPSRRPKPANIEYFDGADEAEKAGYRPCRRCNPRGLEPRAGLIADLCRYLEANSDRRIGLTELAAFAGLSPFHIQRVFREELGVSPREYLQSIRRREARPDEAINFAIADSPLGRMLVAESKTGLCGISFGSDDEELVQWLCEQFPYAELVRGEPAEACAAVVRAIDGSPCPLPLDIRGTAFQQKVWRALQSVPRGITWTYEELAEAIGRPRAVRAAAHACATNRLALVIPCHRIVRKTGHLGGYRWGLDRKRELLRMEHSE